MARLARWRLFLVMAMALALISVPHAGVRAQDAGTVTTANPEAAIAAVPAATEAAPAPEVTTATPVATEAATVAPPTSTEAAAPVATEAAAVTSTPTSAPTQAPTASQTPTMATVTSTAASADSTPSSTGSTPNNTPVTATSAPTTAQVASESSATMLQEATSSQSSSSLRSGGSGSSASSLSSASKSAGDPRSTGTLNGSSSTKTLVIAVLGGVGLTIILSLLFVVWRSQKRENPDLGTPTQSDTATIMFPPASMPAIVAPTAQDMSAWKVSGSSFASRDLPLIESTRAKLNATTRSSTEYDLADRPSQIVSLSARGTTTHMPQHIRGTNASSEQSFSIRGYSELSILRAGDSETSAMTSERYSTNDGYSTSDRYSTSSRLSSEPGRSNSGWFQKQVPMNLDMHRFSSSSTASSIVARKHNPVSFINHDLTQTPTADAPVATDSTTSRTDVPDWYSVIESPTDNDRYTTSSLDSDNISDDRASFEL
ncbi:hypothetical protein PF005_g17359 [Phytophthora fragariae]|uniref:Uncharacterized protein n=1 Tax=Phytophthora fragariae TaxID=53985 RepID=A0A6A3LDW8_9STRA|nr:hypothetical protein PF003_g31548 [Phytophthora fragariae]KAE8940242.1 hypothetical protein PF009_g9950 [Phytophthora fragariae]KAE9017616.1 hypothetical protein PF011_g6630 [Phytophthora fragariae]KAE9113927.1 hypothetical protein PF007_g10576 [Phytophthora fragariae]KAE9127960.1 hypothetical protein PF006_g16394 [Phytophthora fragariae]